MTINTRPELLVREVIGLLIDKQWQLSTAESLTGGLIASAITAVPGASHIFRGGVVSYQNDIKINVLGVSSIRISETGPVDVVVAEQMAQGARDILGADVAIAVTGVAGPGDADGKQAGTVIINVTTPEGSATKEHLFTGDRRAVRDATVVASLELLLELIR